MSWSTDDGKHEAWSAPTFGDGGLGTGSNANGILVSRIGTRVLDYDDWQTRPETEVIGWTTVCECGWRGPLWTGVRTEAEQDLSARQVYCPDMWDDPQLEDLCYDEWRVHIAPMLALTEVAELARRKREVEGLLEAAAAKARAAGASDHEIARAASGW